MTFADRFVLAERVGVGATGEVFRAFDKERGIDVAIKRLHEYLVADPFSRERFRCETLLSSRIDSEHVVKCLDGGVDETDRPYLVLEWLDGRDLAEHIKATPISTHQAIEITRQTALGLQAIHATGIVHRDVKPRNLFFVEEREGKPFVVKLLDLGVAYDAHTDRPEGATMGTPFYMSPEQAQASASIDYASDLFSLGTMFFELLTGRKPFVGPTTFCLLAKIALQATPSLAQFWPEAPAEFEAFMTRALARNPAARFSSAREMALELDRLASVDLLVPHSIDSVNRLSFLPNPEHLVGVVFGRLPLSSHVGRWRDFIQRIVQEYGGFVVQLLGRGIVAIFHGECADAALRAADAVLDLAQQVAGARWSLATAATLPLDAGLPESLIERGARSLERPRTCTNESCVRIDDEAARLLEEHYIIEGSPGALSLRAVRKARG